MAKSKYASNRYLRSTSMERNMTPSRQYHELKNLIDTGKRHYDDHNYPDALECAEQAIKEDRLNKNAWLLKGIVLREIGRIREAISCFDEAIILDGDFYEGYIGNCAAYLALGENSRARKYVERALEIHPRLSDAHGWKAFVAYFSEQYDTAKASYMKAISYEKGKKSASIRTNLGMVFSAIGMYEDALNYYATASELDKKDAEPVIQMAFVIQEIYANKEESNKKIIKALELDSNAVYVYWIALGISLQEEGKYEVAIDYFDKALASDSLFKSLALINIGISYFKQTNYIKSINYFNSVIEDESNYSAIALLCKSLALSKLNNFVEAAECYRSANKLDNDYQNYLSKEIIYPDIVGNLIFFKGYNTNLLASLIKEAEMVFNTNKIAQDSIIEVNQIKRSDEEFSNIQRIADENGSKGESIINYYLDYLKEQGKIRDFEWISKTDKFSPYDFCIMDANNEQVFLDVKSTNGEFNQRIFISDGELKQIAFGKERYDLYRVYEMNDQVSKLRISIEVRVFAKKILEVFEGLPEGVIPYSVSISPSSLQFDPEINLCEIMGKLEHRF